LVVMPYIFSVPTDSIDGAGACEQYSDDNIPGPTIVQEQEHMGSQPSVGIGPSADLLQQHLAFVSAKPDSAIHGLTSRFGCFPNSNPGSSHVFLTTSVSLSFRCGAI